MSTFVCRSARISLEPHAWSLPIFVHVAYGRGSIFLQQDDEIPRGRANFGGFLPHWQCFVQHSIWHLGLKQKWLNQSRCHLGWWVGLAQGTVCYMGWLSQRRRGNLGGKHLPTSLIPLIIANLAGPCSETQRAWLQALDESIISHEGRWDCTPPAECDIYDVTASIQYFIIIFLLYKHKTRTISALCSGVTFQLQCSDSHPLK